MKTHTLVEKLLNLSKTFTHLSTQANLHLLLYLLLPMVPQAPNVIASAGSLKDKNLKKKFFNITTMPLPNLKEIYCVTSFEFISTQISLIVFFIFTLSHCIYFIFLLSFLINTKFFFSMPHLTHIFKESFFCCIY